PLGGSLAGAARGTAGTGPPVPAARLGSGLERVGEHVVGHAPALPDALGLVERPVDAEVDAALAVLLLGLGQGREAARQERPHLAVVAHRLAVELVGREREGDVVGP